MHDDIDRMLADEEKISPSPGFVNSVMAAVEREPAVPQPFEFPWLRVLPGFLATVVALAGAAWNTVVTLSDPAAASALTEQLRQLVLEAESVGLQWVLLAAAITVASTMLPVSLMRAGSVPRFRR